MAASQLRLSVPSSAVARSSTNKWWPECSKLAPVKTERYLKSSFPGNVRAFRSPRVPSAQGRFQVTALFKQFKKSPKVEKEVIVPDPDYRLPIVLLGAAGTCLYAENLLAAVPLGFLGLFLLFQTTRVKFVFGADALEVRIGDELQDSGENVFVGGENSWKYSTFVNWEMWWPKFPILVYFKETQTKPESQIHFFPILFNGKQIYDVMVERAGPSKNSGPK